MTLEEIDQFIKSVGEGIRLFGYTSTSVNRDEAQKFAWENKESGHHKVLFHIKWNS